MKFYLIKDVQDGVTSIVWTVYGKVRQAIKLNTANNQAIKISYRYDATGNRIEKWVKNTTANTLKITYYLRDAQGNVMGVYEKAEQSQQILLSEKYLYASDRVGVYNYAAFTELNANTFTRRLGRKKYEMKDHLGNVRAVISDRLVADGSTVVPDLLSVNNYYSFGMEMTGRNSTSPNYRYGFNGKEKDIDFQNNYDYGFRIYNTKIAKFLSVDPLTKKYPELTPYQFASNRPIDGIDLDGLENIYYLNTLKLNRFASSNDLRLSTDKGIEEQNKIYSTENKSIKHDVYIYVVDAKTFNTVTTGIAYTRSFNNDQLNNEGKFIGQNLRFSDGSGEKRILSEIDFSASTKGQKQIHVIVINKDRFENLDQENQSLVVQHELEAHTTVLIENEDKVYQNNTLQEHEDYHGFKTISSPLTGDEKPNTPQIKFVDMMRKSFFNKKNN